MICLFLAILELVKRQAVSLQQGELFGDIDVRRHELFDEVFHADNPAATIKHLKFLVQSELIGDPLRGKIQSQSVDLELCVLSIE